MDIAAEAVPAYDYIMVLVNDSQYGGSGGSVCVASTGTYSSEVLLHEFGHTFAGLADEYDSPYAYPPGDPEPNVTYDTNRTTTPWRWWIEATTPLPTPETNDYSDVIGLFEGARYVQSGIYRPVLSRCKMRQLNVGFDSVCIEAHIAKIYDFVAPVDESQSAYTVPANGTVVIAPELVQTTSGTVQVTWEVNGVAVREGEGTLTFDGATYGEGTHQVVATIEDVTDLMRIPTNQALAQTEVEFTVVVEQADETPPEITVDPTLVELFYGSAEPDMLDGVTATDNRDGDLIGSVLVGGRDVDVNRIGTYIVTYDVADTAGNDADQKTRTYRVTGWTVTAQAGTNGIVAPGAVELPPGSDQYFLTLPSAGYEAQLWRVDGVVVQVGGEEYTLEDIQADHELTVTFCATDQDHDGMPDWWEEQYGDLSANADGDGDGIPNIVEYQEELDPTVPNNDVDYLILFEGWNLASVSEQPGRATVAEFFGTRAIDTVRLWDAEQQQYENASDQPLESTTGYWVCAVQTCGILLESDASRRGGSRLDSMETGQGRPAPSRDADQDHDGMPDWWEEQYGDLVAHADDDGDGIPNIVEYQEGLNPIVADTGVNYLILFEGWNLASVPGQPLRTTVAEFFGETIVGAVWGWDAERQSYEDVSDQQIEGTSGYWVRAPATCGIRLD